MGTSTNAYLMYGYDLGGGDGPWKVQGIDEYEPWEPDWLDEEEGLAESVLDKLREHLGFTEKDWRAEGYFERRKAIDEQIGVHVESHCSGEYPMYILSAKKFTARRGYVEAIDAAELQRLVVDEDLDGKLARALEVLDFRPIQERPTWLLASYWSS